MKEFRIISTEEHVYYVKAEDAEAALEMYEAGEARFDHSDTIRNEVEEIEVERFFLKMHETHRIANLNAKAGMRTLRNMTLTRSKLKILPSHGTAGLRRADTNKHDDRRENRSTGDLPTA